MFCSSSSNTCGSSAWVSSNGVVGTGETSSGVDDQARWSQSSRRHAWQLQHLSWSFWRRWYNVAGRCASVIIFRRLVGLCLVGGGTLKRRLALRTPRIMACPCARKSCLEADARGGGGFGGAAALESSSKPLLPSGSFRIRARAVDLVLASVIGEQAPHLWPGACSPRQGVNTFHANLFSAECKS